MKKKFGAYTLLQLIISIVVVNILASVALDRLDLSLEKPHRALAKEFYASFRLGLSYIQAEWQLEAKGESVIKLDNHTLHVNNRGNLVGVDGHEVTGGNEASARVCADLANYSHSVLTMSFYPTTKSNFDKIFKEYGLNDDKPELYEHTFAVYSGTIGGQPICTYVYAHSLDPVYIIRYFPGRERAVVFDEYSQEDYFSYFSIYTPTQTYLKKQVRDKTG